MNRVMLAVLALALLPGCAFWSERRACSEEIAAVLDAGDLTANANERPRYVAAAQRLAEAGDYEGCLVVLGVRDTEPQVLTGRQTHDAWIESQAPEERPRPRDR